jgi:hypothetical protein
MKILVVYLPSQTWNGTEPAQCPALESESNRYCNTIALKSNAIVSFPMPQAAARRRDISLTLAM